MASRVYQCHPKPPFQPVKIQPCAIPRATQLPYNSRPRRTPILCASTKKSAAENSNLATDFAKQVSRINTNVTQREDAMKKSREMLFGELFKFWDLEEDDVEMRWDEMNQEEKKVLVKGFVDEWDANFHPLSARSVEDLIAEHIQEKKKKKKKKKKELSLPSSELSSSAFFPRLRRLMRFASE